MLISANLLNENYLPQDIDFLRLLAYNDLVVSFWVYPRTNQSVGTSVVVVLTIFYYSNNKKSGERHSDNIIVDLRTSFRILFLNINI